MALLKNSSPASFKKPSQTWDHIPRRRKRHNRSMLVLLIFVNCCSTSILCSSDVQAKKGLDAVIFKSEKNMFGTDKQSTQHFGFGNAMAKAEDNAEVDKTNEWIQLKRSENKTDDGSKHTSEVIEMMQQPSHTLRHQEHYKQQQQQQQKQQQPNSYPLKHNESKNDSDKIDDIYDDDYNDDDDVADADADGNNNDNENNRHLRYQEIQEALRQPITASTPHHRRHEYHLVKQQLAEKPEFKFSPHHLRHQHHHQQEFRNNRQPQLRHLNHEMRKQNLSHHVSHGTMPPHQRYFDRESLYTNPFDSMAVPTEGPRFRHSDPKRHWQSVAYDLVKDDANIIENKMKDSKRFSLSLETNDDTHYDENANENVADENGDYSYEDDNDSDEELVAQRAHHSTIGATNSKTNVKRYTNPLRSLYKSPLRMEDVKQNVNDNDYDYENNDNSDDNKNSKSASFSSNTPEESLSDNDDDKFSDEKWNKIEHEHYRKQLQHQRAMQALRYRRPLNDQSLPPHHPTTTYNNNAWTKRQTVNNDDEDNIYSRYYVPGTMTRKKEEELGSPRAILETRRQYTLQQRQNKALASAHHRRIVTEGSCRLPQPRIERIRRDSWKIYTPHCTILHRCSDDAGCCPSERQTCAPKRTKNVDLYFFVISLNETQGSIEKLTFVNHTECHCVDRSKQRAPEYGNSRSKEFITNNQIPFLRRATILNCYCPNLFEKILQEDGYCRCDCSSGNLGCDWLKRGMEHFSMNDRKCIIEGRCKLPTCEYGQYIKKHGRCPRREERHLSADVNW